MTTTVDLSGRVAVVTGGGEGIGGAISDALAAAGARVVVAEIDEQRAHERVASIESKGHTAEAVLVDVRVPADVARLADTVRERHGRADILVNNVGHYLKATPFLDSDAAHWDALHAVNLLHVLTCTRAFLPPMVERNDGAIVNVSSV